MQRSRVTRIVAGFTLVAALAACGGSTEKTGGAAPKAGEDVEGSLVGVTMPTRSSERWIADGDNVKAALEKLATRSASSTPRTRSRPRSSRSRTRSPRAPGS